MNVHNAKKVNPNINVNLLINSSTPLSFLFWNNSDEPPWIILALSATIYFIHSKQPTNAEENLPEVIEPIEEPEEESVPLIKYEGPVHHVFFHSLIAYTDLAFDNDG